MTIITGAKGFVGKRLRKFITGFSQEIDLLNPKALTRLPKNPNLIIHLAAQTSTASRDHRVNDIGLKNLLQAVGKLDNHTHIIYIGTMVNVVGRLDCRYPVDESTPYYPTNEYTRTKSAGEKYLISMAKKHKFRLTILIPNTIYGPNVRQNSLLDILKRGILSHSLLTRINWPGKSALIHVNDVVKAIVAASKNPPPPGRPVKYFLYAENLSISDISRLMHQKLSVPYQPVIIPSFVWSIFRRLRQYIPYFEKLLPAYLYNQLWRAGIIVDDVVMARSDKIKTLLPKWKPILLAQGLY